MSHPLILKFSTSPFGAKAVVFLLIFMYMLGLITKYGPQQFFIFISDPCTLKKKKKVACTENNPAIFQFLTFSVLSIFTQNDTRSQHLYNERPKEGRDGAFILGLVQVKVMTELSGDKPNGL